MSRETKNIIIGGDFVPTESNKVLFNEGKTEDLFGVECVNLFRESDLSLVNLEAPLVDVESPIKKWGPNLIAPKCSVKVMKDLGIDLVGLSNNQSWIRALQGYSAHLRHYKQ